METCGFCGGSGLIPGPKHDAYGPRSDYPDFKTCDYCGGSGRVDDGHKLLTARLAADPAMYGEEARRRYHG